jgi:hypothetical protein
MNHRTSLAILTAAALALTLGACGGSDDGGRPDRTAAAVASATASVAPTTTQPTPTSTTPPPPSTPEEKINTLAEENGWVLDDSDAVDAWDGIGETETPEDNTPAAFVQDVCDSLPDRAHDEPAQWLAENQATEPDQMSILKAGIPLLCPEWTKTVKQAASGHYPVSIGEGTFKVTSKRAEDTVPPGTYRTTGDLEDCYWERTKANGDIIDNNFATAATKITVTILPSDDLFTSENCDTWKPVG